MTEPTAAHQAELYAQELIRLSNFWDTAWRTKDALKAGAAALRQGVPQEHEKDSARLATASASAPQEPDQRADQWRPIETAPKDGALVLLWAGDDYFDVGRWDYGCWFERGMEYTLTPTHWMPLPALPSLGQREET